MSKQNKFPETATQLEKLASDNDLSVRRGNGKVVVSSNKSNSVFVVGDHPRAFDKQTSSRLRKWLVSVGIIASILIFIIIRGWLPGIIPS